MRRHSTSNCTRGAAVQPIISALLVLNAASYSNTVGTTADGVDGAAGADGGAVTPAIVAAVIKTTVGVRVVLCLKVFLIRYVLYRVVASSVRHLLLLLLVLSLSLRSSLRGHPAYYCVFDIDRTAEVLDTFVSALAVNSTGIFADGAMPTAMAIINSTASTTEKIAVGLFVVTVVERVARVTTVAGASFIKRQRGAAAKSLLAVLVRVDILVAELIGF